MILGVSWRCWRVCSGKRTSDWVKRLAAFEPERPYRCIEDGATTGGARSGVGASQRSGSGPLWFNPVEQHGFLRQGQCARPRGGAGAARAGRTGQQRSAAPQLHNCFATAWIEKPSTNQCVNSSPRDLFTKRCLRERRALISLKKIRVRWRIS